MDNLGDHDGDIRLSCGKCDKPMRRGDSYCRFCAGEQPVEDTPEGRYLEGIARVCYEAVRAFSKTQGDFGIVPWESLNPVERARRVQGIRWRIENLDRPLPEIHNAWVEKMKSDGWELGPRKNTHLKFHPCLVEWDELPVSQQRKDALFAAVVRTLTKPVE